MVKFQWIGGCLILALILGPQLIFLDMLDAQWPWETLCWELFLAISLIVPAKESLGLSLTVLLKFLERAM